MKKLTLLAAAAVGYVLGTKAGRERYEQIKAQAEKLWSSEPVQSTVDTVQNVARDAASEAGHKAADVAGTVGDKVAESASEAASAMTSKVKSAADFASEGPGDADAAAANETWNRADDLSAQAQAGYARADAEAAFGDVDGAEAAQRANEAQTAAEDLAEAAQSQAARGDATAAYTKDAIDEQLEETVIDEPRPGSTS